MASRTYREEEVGPQSTNRFIVPREIPTTVVTGAETKLASVQPNLTGKRKLPYQPDDPAEVPDVGKVDSLGEWLTAIGGGLTLGMWASEIGLLGKDAQTASSNFLKSSAKKVDAALGTEPRRKVRAAIPEQAPGVSLQEQKNFQQAITLGRDMAENVESPYSETEEQIGHGTTMGDTPGSEMGTY